VPSQLRLLLAAGLLGRPGWQPSLVLAGGEAIDIELWQKLHRAQTVQFYNMYGLTECTVDSVICHINHHADRPVIGRPLPNTECYILDQYEQLLPVGVPGQLYIGGAGVARGYFNRPALTAQYFVRHPFSANPAAVLYKTGDLARYLPNGDIEFLGRIDHQLKIRGYRIEPGEIELALQRHPAVQTAIVTAVGSDRLAAYLLPEADRALPTTSKLRSFLARSLPAYIIPTLFVPLTDLPLTPNGKIDRRALPPPDPAATPSITLPQSELEYAVASVWADVLDLRRVGRDDNFFDLGGHSLLATRLVARIQQVFRCNIALSCVFEAPTVAEFSVALVGGHPRPEQLDKIARLFNRIQQMPAEAVEQALARKKLERTK
jgi:hypothetical protein